MGAAVGLLWRKRHKPGTIAAGGIGLAGLVLSIGYLAPALSLATSPHLDAWRVGIFGLPSALLIYALAGIEQLYQKQRSPALLVAFSDWSYATYLTHVLVISAIGRALILVAPAGGISASVVLILAGLVAANTAGAGVHVLFERTTLSWLRQFGSRSVEPMADEATR